MVGSSRLYSPALLLKKVDEAIVGLQVGVVTYIAPPYGHRGAGKLRFGGGRRWAMSRTSRRPARAAG